jgi:hypothetical protein
MTKLTTDLKLLCTYPGCTRIAKCKKSTTPLCAAHYIKKRQGAKPCTVCGKPSYLKSLCTRHYGAWYRYGSSLAPIRDQAPRGSGSSSSKGYLTSKGYTCITINGKGIRKHRLLMEEVLGRPLLPNENVHHKDGDRSNNTITNLEVWVTKQPAGQRIEDKLEYAQQILSRYQGSNKPSLRGRAYQPLTSNLSLSDRRRNSRGVQLLWDTISELGTATTTELAGLLGISRKTLGETIRKSEGLFEKSPTFSTDHNTSIRWRIRLGAKRPEHTRQGHINKHGYKVYSVDGKYSFEHRLVMEQHLGRRLSPKENVHHKDGDRLNNDISNLELWSTSQPPGQRIEDIVQWAYEIIELYGKQPT